MMLAVTVSSIQLVLSYLQRMVRRCLSPSVTAMEGGLARRVRTNGYSFQIINSKAF